MASYTPKLGLEKPDGAENIRRSVLNGNADLLDSFADTVSTDVEGLSDSVAGLSNNLTQLSNNHTQLQTTVSTLSGSHSQLQATVSQLSTDQGQLETDITTVSGNLSQLQTTVSGISTTQGTMGTSITNLTEDVSQLQTDLTDLSNSIPEPVDISGLETTVGTLSTTVGGLSTTVSGLSTTVGGLSTNLGNLTTSVSTVQDDLNDHLADYIRNPGYGVDTGSGDAYAITVTPAITSYVAGQAFIVKCGSANTGAATLSVCGLSAIAIRKLVSNSITDLGTGDIPAGGTIQVVYNGTYFIAIGIGLGSHLTATAVHGINGAVVGTTDTQTLTNKTFTTPVLNSPRIYMIYDTTYSKLVMAFGAASAAVNYLSVSASAAGSPIVISPGGSDTNIDINITPKGTGVLKVGGSPVLLHNLATAADDFIVASGAGVFVKKTLAETKATLGITSVLTALSGDTAPSLGGALNQNGHTISGAETDNGNSGTAKTINWTLGNHQKVTMTGNCVFTFTPPAAACALSLRIIQDATGGRTITLPQYYASGGTALTFSTTANAVDILSIYYDGTRYYCQLMTDAKAVG